MLENLFENTKSGESMTYWVGFLAEDIDKNFEALQAKRFADEAVKSNKAIALQRRIKYPEKYNESGIFEYFLIKR